MPEHNPSFLKRYDLHKSPEADRVAKRTKAKAGVDVGRDPEARIQNYLDYLKEIIENNDVHERQQKLDKIKRTLYDQFVIKPENIPEGYFENQRRINREHGLGDQALTKEMRDNLTEIVIGDQERSLDAWFDYVADPSTTYPDWFKYFALREILRTGSYNIETNTYSGRKSTTIAPFPELNREALAKVLDRVEADPNPPAVKFAPLYAEEVRKLIPLDEKQLQETRGIWREFPKGSDSELVVNSLAGYSTGLCITGHKTAKTYLTNGDLIIYYSLNSEGEPAIPRAAIHRVGGATTEVRGVGEHQNLDRYIAEVVQAKLQTFPDGAIYEKKSNDMKRLTEIDRQFDRETKQWKIELTKSELLFLYEFSGLIQGFGYDKDPRIAELQKARRDAGLLEQDLCIIFECEPNQIAKNQEDLTKNAIGGFETKVYVGPLFKDIFKTFSNIEHIYASFPEGKITRATIEIGGKNTKELEEELARQNIQIKDWTKQIIKSNDFTTAKNPESVDLIRLKVRDLGITKVFTTIDQIYAKAKELGLELCPPEVGPQYRLQYMDQPEGENLCIGMNQIAGSDRLPYIFQLRRVGEGLLLESNWAGSTNVWGSDHEFVFLLRK